MCKGPINVCNNYPKYHLRTMWNSLAKQAALEKDDILFSSCKSLSIQMSSTNK